MSDGSRGCSKVRTLYIAGHTGLVGSALVRRFSDRSGIRLLTAPRSELDLTDSAAVERFLLRHRPDGVIISAGRVGGILTNSQEPADFLYENLMIEANLIHSSWRAGVRRLLNFGSSCMYPRECPQPMKPEHLMTGRLEPTSEPYAIAKWAGLTLCSAVNRQHGTRYMTVIPCTVYGPQDQMDPARAHVLSALMVKFHQAMLEGAPQVILWGTGKARREFLCADDLANACEVLMDSYESDDPINVGSGEAVSIGELAQKIARLVGFKGRVAWDSSRPDGAPEKRLDSTLARGLGWRPEISLEDGLERMYRWFLESSPKKQEGQAEAIGQVR